MSSFDYNAPAELFLAKTSSSLWMSPGKHSGNSGTIAQQVSWPARACAPAGDREISGSSRACNVCSADSNAETGGGKSRVPSPSGTPGSTAPALPSCISWFETRPK